MGRLRLGRMLVLILELLFAGVLQTLPLGHFGLPWEGRSSFLALVVLDASLRDGPWAGAVSGLLAGAWIDLLAGEIIGAGMGAWLIMGYGVGLLGTYLFRERWEVPLLLIPLGTLVGCTLELVFGVIWSPGHPWGGLWLQGAVPATVYNTLLAVMVYGLGHRWFWRLHLPAYHLGADIHAH